jgi:hypothetical protein
MNIFMDDSSRNDQSNIVSVISTNITVITLVTICFGYINLHFYYQTFGITIYPYLEAAEIIFSFASILLIIGLTVAVGIAFRQYFYFSFDKRTYGTDITSINSLALRISGMGASVLGVLILILDLKSDKVNSFIVEQSLLISFLGLALAGYTKSMLSQPIKVFTNLFLFTVFLFANNYIKNALITDYKQPIKHVQLDLDNSYFTSNDSIYFIGDTNNYYFFHNINSRNDRENIIIPKSEVKRITFREN